MPIKHELSVHGPQNTKHAAHQLYHTMHVDAVHQNETGLKHASYSTARTYGGLSLPTNSFKHGPNVSHSAMCRNMRTVQGWR